MKKLMLVITLLFPFTAFGGETPRIGIDGETHVKERKFHNKHKEHHNREIDRIVKEIEVATQRKSSPQPKVVKSQRLWIQDVYQDGLWYYGYYASVDGVYEFRYSRREYKGALTNFRSLYSVYYKDELKHAVTKSVKVIYEPAY